MINIIVAKRGPKATNPVEATQSLAITLHFGNSCRSEPKSGDGVPALVSSQIA